MSDESCRSVPDGHLSAVWQNRQVQTAALNYAKEPVEGDEPLGALFQTGMATAQQLVGEVVSADRDFSVCFDTFLGKGKIEVKDVVAHFEGVLDNITVSEVIESFFPDWWQHKLFTELVEMTLFVSRALRAGCKLRYPMVGNTMWGKYCEVEIDLPSGERLVGWRTFLCK